MEKRLKSAELARPAKRNTIIKILINFFRNARSIENVGDDTLDGGSGGADGAGGGSGASSSGARGGAGASRRVSGAAAAAAKLNTEGLAPGWTMQV